MNSSENNLSGVSTESVEPRQTSDLPEGPRTGADGSGVSAPAHNLSGGDSEQIAGASDKNVMAGVLASPPAQSNFPVPVLAEPKVAFTQPSGEARDSTTHTQSIVAAGTASA